MAKNGQTILPDETIALRPNEVRNKEFGTRVNRLMMAKGWRQSELSRRADLPRDSISSYIRGQSYPSPLSLSKLAKALGVPENELDLQYTERLNVVTEAHPMIEVRISPSNPDTAELRVTAILPTDLALQIQKMVLDAARASIRK